MSNFIWSKLRKVLGYLPAIVLATDFLTHAASASKFESHATYLSSLTHQFVENIDDMDSVLEAVLKELPQNVEVLTTENYSYFTFFHHGLEYQGNVRIEDKENPILHFAFAAKPSPWFSETEVKYQAYSTNEFINISKQSDFNFVVQIGKLRRFFHHPDVSNMLPPPQLLRDNEVFMGKVLDDSGLKFFLIYDSEANTAAYILDETQEVPDELIIPKSDEGKEHKMLLVGLRSGFAFYAETQPSRQRLIGVYDGNVLRNNYFDGPFDQLPDSYVGQLSIRDVFKKVYPDDKDEMDRNGVYVKQDGVRAVVDPYLVYSSWSEFDPLIECISKAETNLHNRQCFKLHLGF